MTKNELILKLENKNVPKDIYSLEGLKDGECLCVVHLGVWDVVYNSKGKITYRESFENVEDAYDRFYEIMKNDYGW